MVATRTALVIGGNGGLGTATISAFLAAGRRVVAPVRAVVNRVGGYAGAGLIPDQRRPDPDLRPGVRTGRA